MKAECVAAGAVSSSSLLLVKPLSKLVPARSLSDEQMIETRSIQHGRPGRLDGFRSRQNGTESLETIRFVNLGLISLDVVCAAAASVSVQVKLGPRFVVRRTLLGAGEPSASLSKQTRPKCG